MTGAKRFTLTTLSQCTPLATDAALEKHRIRRAYVVEHSGGQALLTHLIVNILAKLVITQ